MGEKTAIDGAARIRLRGVSPCRWAVRWVLPGVLVVVAMVVLPAALVSWLNLMMLAAYLLPERVVHLRAERRRRAEAHRLLVDALRGHAGPIVFNRPPNIFRRLHEGSDT